MFDSKPILIDEVLSPDSPLFWPATQYAPGKSQPIYDKQFVRDYLEMLDCKNPSPVRRPRLKSSPRPRRNIWRLTKD